ncbi:hypothetical protein Daura_32305 [Dactylosporangium aurantiacum]|uniref:Uncharacterized protein n=1 Tax=Dactylosporangium aurantiacum TaxID=35754 RepID=A0A9Q9IF63_9ACTN|nr:hypothetical protein [Dactylosporangium aurantiacum]MDG6107123.1 hypothetical protein [Dactylosporangium aurantiacum]UWZ51420.1 hypothetical protein Daura_32305 [Dactylosporangium aurantiacum]
MLAQSGSGVFTDSRYEWHEFWPYFTRASILDGVVVTLPPTPVRRLRRASTDAWARDRLSVADYLKLLPDARPRTVLGRPADWTAGPSLLTNSPWKASTLLVAWDRADSGGTVEVTVLRASAVAGDEATLTRIAERQLSALPGWPG